MLPVSGNNSDTNTDYISLMLVKMYYERLFNKRNSCNKTTY
jgi:hypothetical protein